MKEYIIHFCITEDRESLEARVEEYTMQGALHVFKDAYPTSIVLNIEGPYDIR